MDYNQTFNSDKKVLHRDITTVYQQSFNSDTGVLHRDITTEYQQTFNSDTRVLHRDITTEHQNLQWVDSRNTISYTPLHIAAKYNHLQKLKDMIPNYLNINVNTTDVQGNTVLHVLVNYNEDESTISRQNRTDAIRNLICKGAEINERNAKGWTIIHYAAKHCHIDILEILKNTTANFDLPTLKFETPLIIACKYMSKMKNHPEELQTIKFLINRTLDINAIDKDNYSALHYAAERCSSQAVIELLKNRAYVNLRTKKPELTPLHFAAIKECNLLTVMNLLKAGSIIEPNERDELTPLHMAVIEGSLDVIEYLIDNGAHLNYRDRILKLTPLHLAIYQKRYDVFQLLLDKGADIDGRGKGGLTPLHLSSMLGNVEFTKDFIDRGAKVDCRTNDLLTPLHVATIKTYDLENTKALEADAIKYGREESFIVNLLKNPYNSDGQNYEAVIRLLLCNGANVNALTLSGWSSLHLATKFNRQSSNFLEILLEHGAYLNYRERSSGYTALHLALQNNFDHLVEILVNGGADLNSLTSDGLSPIHLALGKDDTALLKFLIWSGADVNYKEQILKSTALNMALMKNHKESVEILIDAGADINELTSDGKNPLHLVLESNCEKVLESLISSGAKLNCHHRRCLYTILYLSTQCGNGRIIKKLDDSNKTPLFLAMTEEWWDIKKAIYRLAAIVDACNEKSCVTRNSAVDKCYTRSIECLRNCKEEAYDIEAFGKFMTYRVLSSTFSQFHHQPFFCNNTYLSNYITMLNIINLPLTKNYETFIPFYDDGYQKHKNKCRDEVQDMKNYYVQDNITLYNVLHMRSKRRRLYMKNLDLQDIECFFHLYYKLILTYYREDKIKTLFLDTFHWAFYKVTNVDLPILCVEEIYWNMGLFEIISTIQAAEGIGTIQEVA